MVKPQDLIVHRLKNKNYLTETHLIERHLKAKCIAINTEIIHLTVSEIQALIRIICHP